MMKSKFENPTHQTIKILDSHIHVTVKGIITTGSSVENFVKIAQIVDKTQKTRLLLESQFENILSIEQTYQVLEELKKLDLQIMFDVKMAFLPKEEDQFEYFSLCAEALSTQNIFAKAFTDRQTALHWLLKK